MGNNRIGMPHTDKDEKLRAEALEKAAAGVHDAYLTTADRLGWPVKPAMRAPYADLPEDAKELDRATAEAAITEYLSVIERQRGWVPVRLPVNELVRVKTTAGREFTAAYYNDIAVDSDGRSCGAWVAENEDDAPPCWTDGQCWESNENEVASDPVTHWAPQLQKESAR